MTDEIRTEPILTESQVSNTMTSEYLVAMARGQIEPIRQSGKGVFFKKGDEVFRLVFRTSYEAGRFFMTALDMRMVIKDHGPQFARAATNEEIKALEEGGTLLEIKKCAFCQHPKGYHYDKSIINVPQLPCNFLDLDPVDETEVECLCYGWCETKEEAEALVKEGENHEQR